MNPMRRTGMGRWRGPSGGALVWLLAWSALAHAAGTAEEALARAMRGALTPGEGQAGEAIFASPRGVTAGLLLTVASCGGVGGQIGPVDLGLVSSGVELLAAGATKIQREDEVNIGRGAAARILGQYGAWHEPTLRQYVNLVGQTLVQSVGRDDITYHFTILNDDSVNAFSTPGGYVFITRGALRQMRDEAELAGVLGHELAHVNQRHVLSEIEDRYFARRAGDTAMQALEAYGGRGGAATMSALQAGGPVFSQVADLATEVIFRGYSRGRI